MSQPIFHCLVILAALAALIEPALLSAKTLDYLPVDVKNISRYDEDRILYQQYEKPHDELYGEKEDNSIAHLMIIKDKKVYLFKDGYDSPEQYRLNKLNLDKGNQFLPDLWRNKIDNTPDYVLITDRRVEVQKNSNPEWVSSNYKDFYVTVRDKFLKKHVAILLSIIINRLDSDMQVNRRLLPRKIADQGNAKYATTVSARTPDGGTVYYAEDADGDGVTETFTAHCADGFTWGYRCGPNLINIIRNTNKDIEKIIGRIANLAYYGTPEEEMLIKKTFPTSDSIKFLVDDIYYIDSRTEKFLKKNNIDVEASVEKESAGGK